MNKLNSFNSNYNVLVHLFPFAVVNVVQFTNPHETDVGAAVSIEGDFKKISAIFKKNFQNTFTERDLLKPLGISLKELFKRKIESLNLFYDDLPEVKVYYDQFIQDLSRLRYKNLVLESTAVDPFPSLKRIDQALANVGVLNGIQVESFLELFHFIFLSNDLLEVTTIEFFQTQKTKAIAMSKPVKLPIALKLCEELLDHLRADIEKLLSMISESLPFPADLPTNLPHLNVPFATSALGQCLQLLPTDLFLLGDFPGTLERAIGQIFQLVQSDCDFLRRSPNEYLKSVTESLKRFESVSQDEDFVWFDVGNRGYGMKLDKLKRLKEYYENAFSQHAFFDAFIEKNVTDLCMLFRNFNDWKEALPNRAMAIDFLKMAIKELCPETHQEETDSWLKDLEKEKLKKQKKHQKRAAKPKSAKQKGLSLKKVEPVRPPSPEKPINLQPHPVLFGIIAGIENLNTSAFYALRQAYLYEGDLKLIQRKVVQGGLADAQMNALFLSTVRTSYLHLEQLFRSLKEDQEGQYASEKSHDLYSFGSQFVELNPKLIQELFLGNFWVDYAEDHVSRWRKSGAMIDRSTPPLLTRSERVFKRGSQPIASSEITDLIQNVFETKSRWLKIAYAEEALGAEGLKDRKFPLSFPQISLVQSRKQLQGLMDQNILDRAIVDQQLRTLAYLEETLKGADEAGSSAENSYRLRTALHLMHLAIEWGFEQYGQKRGLRDFKDHNLLQLAKNVDYPLAKNKEKYLKRFFQLARPLSSYPYDLAGNGCDLTPLILKLDYKANYALHQKERPLFPKINLSKEESGKLVSALVNGFIPLLGDVLKSLQV